MQKLRTFLLLVSVAALAACGDDLHGVLDAPPGNRDAAIDGSVVDGSVDAAVDAAKADARVDAMPVDMDIRDLQMGVVTTGSPVRCAGVVVTARGDGATSSVIFVQ